jgi:hypothetical protein
MMDTAVQFSAVHLSAEEVRLNAGDVFDVFVFVHSITKDIWMVGKKFY